VVAKHPPGVDEASSIRVAKHPPKTTWGSKVSTRDESSDKVSTRRWVITHSATKHLPERGDQSESGKVSARTALTTKHLPRIESTATIKNQMTAATPNTRKRRVS